MSARRSRDAGVTLVELLISIVILGLIMGSIGLLLITFLRNEAPTSQRMTTPRFGQALSQFFPSDVQGADPAAVDVTGSRASGCSTSPGTNVLWLQSSVEGTTTYTSYRLEQVGARLRLLRITCSAANPAATTSVQSLAGDLPSTSTAVATPTLSGSLVTRLAFVLRVPDATAPAGWSVFSLTASPRRLTSPGPTNPPTTPPSTSVIGDCTITDVDPDSLQVGANGRLVNATPIDVLTTGTCQDLRLRIFTGVTPAVDLALTQGTGGRWSGTLTTDYVWQAGVRRAEVWEGNPPVTLYVQDFTITSSPCAVTSFTPVALTTDASGRLTNATTVTITTAGVCNPLTLSVPAGVSPAISQAFAAGATPGTWTTTLGTTQQWTTGTVNALVVENGSPIFTQPLTVGGGAPPCTLVSLTPTTISVAADSRLAAPVTVTVTTSGACGTLTLTFTDPVLSLPLNGGPATFTATLPTSAVWPIGSVTATVRNSGTSIGTRTITVSGGPCRFESGSATPSSVQRQGQSAAGNLQSDVVIAVRTTGVCSGISVTFVPGTPPNSGTQSTNLPLELSAGVWTKTINRNSYSWTAGSKTFTVNGTTNGGSFTLQVNP